MLLRHKCRVCPGPAVGPHESWCRFHHDALDKARASVRKPPPTLAADMYARMRLANDMLEAGLISGDAALALIEWKPTLPKEPEE